MEKKKRSFISYNVSDDARITEYRHSVPLSNDSVALLLLNLGRSACFRTKRFEVDLSYVLKALRLVSPSFFQAGPGSSAHYDTVNTSLSANLRAHGLHALPEGVTKPSTSGKQQGASYSGANLWLAEQL